MRALIVVGKYTVRVGSFLVNFIMRDGVDGVVFPIRDGEHVLAGEVAESLVDDVEYVCGEGEGGLIDCVSAAIATHRFDAILFITAKPTREWLRALALVLRLKYFNKLGVNAYAVVIERGRALDLNPLFMVEYLNAHSP